MSTAALQKMWDDLKIGDLPVASKRWLAHRLLQDVGEIRKPELVTKTRIARTPSRTRKSRGYTYETWEDIPLELRQAIEQGRREHENGETVVCHNREEMHKFFDSL